MKVSAVIPLYNKAELIERAVRSVLAQTHSQLELIVIDDGSTDGGAEVVQRIADPRIRLISQANAGASAARNRGIAESTAELIAFLDADDTWKPEFLEIILELCSAFPQAGIYGCAFEFSRHGHKSLPKISGLPAAPWQGLIPRYFRRLSSSWWPPFCSSSMAAWKRVLEEVGGYHIGLAKSEDVDMWARVALRHPIACSSAIGATYFRDDINTMINTAYCPSGFPFAEAARQVMASGQVDPESLRGLQEYVASLQLRAAQDCLYVGADQSAALGLLRGHRETRLFRLTWAWLYFWSLAPRPLLEAFRWWVRKRHYAL